MVVPPQRAGMAAGISNTLRIGGLATGVAALGALLQHRVATRLPELLPGAPHALASAVASGGTRAATAIDPGAATAAAARTAFVSGLNLSLVVGAAALAVGTVAVVAWVRPSQVAHAIAATRPEPAPDAPPAIASE